MTICKESIHILGGFLALFLPETLGAPLPETMEEIRHLFTQGKPWYKWMSRQELKVLRAKQDMAKASANGTTNGHATSVKPTVSFVPEIQIQAPTPSVARAALAPIRRFLLRRKSLSLLLRIVELFTPNVYPAQYPVLTMRTQGQYIFLLYFQSSSSHPQILPSSFLAQ